MRQSVGVTEWDTPYGKNHRYTVQFDRLGERSANEGLRPLRGSISYRVITPNGEPTAVAIAARWFDLQNPQLSYRKVVVLNTEVDFQWQEGDLRDDDSRAR